MNSFNIWNIGKHVLDIGKHVLDMTVKIIKGHLRLSTNVPFNTWEIIKVTTIRQSILLCVKYCV